MKLKLDENLGAAAKAALAAVGFGRLVIKEAVEEADAADG